VLNVAQQDIYPGMIFVGMACVAVLGYLTTRVLASVEARALPWVQMARA
jgi:NitT/TauT family transport system permease protein/taurine transport system permease protein